MGNANLIVKAMMDRQIDAWLKSVTVSGSCTDCPRRDGCPHLVKVVIEAFKQYVVEISRWN
jgi:hypothetical protein